MDIAELLENNGIETRSKGQDSHARDGWIQIKCPFCCNSSFHMGINQQNLSTNCYRCGPSKVYQVLQALQIPRNDIQSIFSAANFISYNKDTKKSDRKLKLPKGLRSLTNEHTQYLYNRRLLPGETERIWRVQGLGALADSRLRFRIFIPIYHQGQMVSWTTRDILKSKRVRYLSASPDEEIINHKHLLLGEDFCTDTIVVTEGPFDVFAIGPGAVCTFGTNWTKKQIKRISKYKRRVICLDKSASEVALRYCEELSIFEGETYNITLEGKDPSESYKESQQIRERFLS